MEPPLFFSMPGQWSAEGCIELPLGLEKITFRAVWSGHGPLWTQQVYLEGVEEPVLNAYKLEEGPSPRVLLESPHLGSLEAVLTRSASCVGWEYKTDLLSGYELFHRQEDGSYLHRAEFTGEHGMRTKIDSRLTWQGVTT
jgi:hypothetical protein